MMIARRHRLLQQALDSPALRLLFHPPAADSAACRQQLGVSSRAAGTQAAALDPETVGPQSEGAGASAEPVKPSGGSGFWRAASFAIGASFAAAAAGGAYVTYAYDNATIKAWLKERKEQVQSPQSDPGSQVNPSALPELVKNSLLDLVQQYVDIREDAEERLHKFTSPTSDKLLPDLLPNERHVYTLVVDLEGTLVEWEWKRDRGWRTFKRPGADAFLERMAQFYEVVVFSDQIGLTVDPVLDRLDPNRCIRFRLYRDATQYTKGHYIRDLSKLNRNPGQVLYISTNPKSVVQQDNLILLPPWNVENAQDTSLLDLLPFLEFVARQKPPDTRAVLASYEGQDIPKAFKERAKHYQRQLQERKQGGLLRFR